MILQFDIKNNLIEKIEEFDINKNRKYKFSFLKNLYYSNARNCWMR